MFTATLPKGYTNHALSLGGMAQPAKTNFEHNLRNLIGRGVRGPNGEMIPVNETSLAKGLGVTPTTVNRWLNGKREPSFADLDALAAFFGVHVDDFFEDPTVEKSAQGITLERALKMVATAAALGGPMLAAPVPTKRDRKKSERMKDGSD